MRNGDVKRVVKLFKDKTPAFDVAINYPSLDKKNYKFGERFVIKFEDLKCNPKKILLALCEQWEIHWSDTLMQTTCNGKKCVHNNGEYNIGRKSMDIRTLTYYSLRKENYKKCLKKNLDLRI